MTPSRVTFASEGGAVQACHGLYFEREADREVERRLQQGGLSHILDARQVGKSSLLIRALQRIEAAGGRAFYQDLSTLSEAEASDMFAFLAGNLGLDGRFLSGLDDAQAAARFIQAVSDMAGGAPVLILIDEISAMVNWCTSRTVVLDSLTRLPPNVTVMVAGIALADDLWGGPAPHPLTPDRRILLRDFTLEELAPAAYALPSANASEVVSRVHSWTGGHPYLTMHLLAEVQSRGDDVDAAVQRVFLNKPAEDSKNLFFVQSQLERGAMSLYRRVRSGEIVPVTGSQEEQRLLLSGIVVADGAALRVRNKLYETYFDMKKLDEIAQPGPFQLDDSI